MNVVKLVVVDDHALFRAGLINLLNGMPEFQVVGEADNGMDAVSIIQSLNPDVALIDVNMPILGGVDTVRKLKRSKDLKIIMLTISRNDDDLLGSIGAGADGYILKNAEPEELRKAILLVRDGMSILSPEITKQVMSAVNFDTQNTAENELSDRELEVLECLSNGRTTTQIASELFISENTVKTHVRHILEKLSASNRAEAVSKAIHMGIIRQNE